ncbi:hypothetical protein EGW08_020773 [Elysia chlorotica]|uniref:Uncharacterized protein n=1 Tax=Elysia chlorotica TaxID=188477 RepID=A0A3S1AZY0_ELYCH|nr:hypothetical protein EGW08_020773 [Elysia chlorotica]
MKKSPSHLRNIVTTTAKQFLTLGEAVLGEFLAVSVDFNVISPELSQLGITKTTLENPPALQTFAITNKAVIDFETYRVQALLPKSLTLVTIQWLQRHTDISGAALQCAINSAIKAYNGFLKNKHRRPDQLVMFLTGEFSASSAAPPVTYPATPAPLPPATVPAPLPPVTVPAPLPPVTVPAPLPPVTVPAPLPPVTVPAPLPPVTVPAPLPPVTVPAPLPPVTVPAPLPPVTVPARLPPVTVPAPLPPVTVRHGVNKARVPKPLTLSPPKKGPDCVKCRLRSRQVAALKDVNKRT